MPLSIHSEGITCGRTYFSILQKDKHGEYLLFSNDTATDVNELTWCGTKVYLKDLVVRQIASLVKRNDVILLTQLLFSPNHMLAISSMEALTFLEIKKRAVLSGEIHVKMRAIVEANIPISVKYGDVTDIEVVYKTLGILKSDILRKYQGL